MFKIITNHIHLNLFGLHIKLRCDFIKFFQNKVYIITKSGKLKRVFISPNGVEICFKGVNSVVKLAKSKRYKKVKLILNDNSNIDINSPHKWGINNVLIEAGDKSSVLIDKDFSCAGGEIISIGEGIKLNIGKDCMFSKGIRLSTSDGHDIIDINTQEILNKPKDIIIGDNVWLGLGANILKGVVIEKDSVVAAGAIVSKSPEESNVVLVGIPARIVKRNVSWKR